MKYRTRISLVLLAIMTVCFVNAEAHPERATVATTHGEIYDDARILSVGFDYIIILHEGSIETIDYRRLSPESQALFEFDLEAGEEDRAQRRQAAEERRQSGAQGDREESNEEIDESDSETAAEAGSRSLWAEASDCAPAWEDGPTGADHNAGIGRRPERLPSTGTLQAVFLFVDFRDAAANSPIRTHTELMLPRGPNMLRDLSYGQLALDVTTINRWFRMPRRSTDYGIQEGMSFDDHRSYVADAVSAAASHVDFSEFDLVYVMAPRSAIAIEYSSAFVPQSEEDGVEVNGTTILNAVTFGLDIWQEGWEHRLFVHETGHLLDLPALYAVQGSAASHVGEWDIMGQFGRRPDFGRGPQIGRGNELLAWNRWKLGWLDEDQVRCLTNNATATVNLSPVSRPEGLKMATIRLDDHRFIAIESRRSEGHDRNIPVFGGVLAYLVDTSIPTGQGPIRLLTNPATSTMGLLLRGQEVTDPSERVTIRLLESEGEFDRVAIRRR